jgi:hypothetical protein
MPWDSNSLLIKVYIIFYLAVIGGSWILTSFSVAIRLRDSISLGVIILDMDFILRLQYFVMVRK